MNAGFVFPQVLWLLLAAIPLIVFWSFVQRRREKKLNLFVVKDNWRLLNTSVSKGARFHKSLLLLLAFVFSVVAAARPYYGVREREYHKRGINIIYAVDVSKSMLATDVGRGSPGGGRMTRLEYAKNVLRRMIVESPGHRIGVMPFAGDAFLQCPLTTDYDIPLEVIKALNVSTIDFQGTNIPEVINQSIGAFERSGNGRKVIVLLTDGEDHSEKINKAIAEAKKKEITIFALGIGSPDGAPVNLPDGSYLESEDGIKVVSRLDVETLRQIAKETGGKAYAASGDGYVDPAGLISDLENFSKEELTSDKRLLREERFQWPLAVALICLILETLIGERRFSKKRQANGTLRRSTA